MENEEALVRNSLRKIARERVRLRLPHRSKAFRSLMLIAIDRLIALQPPEKMTEFGLGLEEPGIHIGMDVLADPGEHWMNCWTMVTIVVGSPHNKKEFKKEDETIIELAIELTEEEWDTIRRHVIRNNGSDGYTPWIKKDWAKKITAMR